MKRLVAIIILLSLAIAGCTADDSQAQSSDQKHRDKEAEAYINETYYELTKYDDFVESFNTLMEALPEFRVTQLEDVPLERGLSARVFVIKDMTFDETYHIHMSCAENGDICNVFITSERHSYGNLQFAVFAYYVYTSMGFSDMDADAFYNAFDLFSKDEISEFLDVQGYTASCITSGKYISFAMDREAT